MGIILLSNSVQSPRYRIFRAHVAPPPPLTRKSLTIKIFGSNEIYTICIIDNHDNV